MSAIGSAPRCPDSACRRKGSIAMIEKFVDGIEEEALIHETISKGGGFASAVQCEFQTSLGWRSGKIRFN